MTTPAARNTDPDTSHAAAASVSLPATVQTRLAILAILTELGPCTDVELAGFYAGLVNAHKAPRVSPSGLRTRRAELVTEGVVVDTGKRVPLESGRSAIVWGRATA